MKTRFIEPNHHSTTSPYGEPFRVPYDNPYKPFGKDRIIERCMVTETNLDKKILIEKFFTKLKEKKSTIKNIEYVKWIDILTIIEDMNNGKL